MEIKYNNKIELANGEILIDLTNDDVKPEHVKKDIWFHDKTGERKQGTNENTVDASGVLTECSEVLEGRAFGKGSTVETGTMPDNSGKTVVMTSKEGVVIPTGYYDAATKAELSSEDYKNLVSAHIKEGITILGVEGSYGADDFTSTTKEVTPAFTEQTFTATEDGFSFYSAVKVAPINVDRKDNDAGGVTVTIG